VNWLAFAVCAWIVMGLELGLRDLLTIPGWGVAPSFVTPLLVFIAMSADSRAAVWAGLLLGLAKDLTWGVERAIGEGVFEPMMIPGPYALGGLLAAHLTLSMRGLVIGKNPLTIGFVTLVASCVVQIVVVFTISIRGVYEPLEWAPMTELLSRLGRAALTGVMGAVMALALLPLSGLFDFPDPHAGFAAKRR